MYNNIYAIVYKYSSNYSNGIIEGYFTNKDDASKFCLSENKNNTFEGHYEVLDLNDCYILSSNICDYKSASLREIYKFLAIKNKNLKNAIDTGYFCDNYSMMQTVGKINRILYLLK